MTETAIIPKGTRKREGGKTKGRRWSRNEK